MTEKYHIISINNDLFNKALNEWTTFRFFQHVLYKYNASINLLYTSLQHLSDYFPRINS